MWIYDQILHLLQNKKMLSKEVSHARYISKSGFTHLFLSKRKYIFQDGGGDHLGFMYEQDLKVKKNVRNDF